MNFGMNFISVDAKDRSLLSTLVLEKQLHAKLAVKMKAT